MITRITLYIWFSYVLEGSSLTMKSNTIDFYGSSGVLGNIITLYSL